MSEYTGCPISKFKSGSDRNVKKMEISPVHIPFTYTKSHFHTPNILEVMSLIDTLTPGMLRLFLRYRFNKMFQSFCSTIYFVFHAIFIIVSLAERFAHHRCYLIGYEHQA